jgi:Ni2+-binding GTPase involved in maturation of urease and hydrogenase
MSKPIIQIKIEGPQGSGKTSIIALIVVNFAIEGKYLGRNVSSSDDVEDSYQLEDDFHIIQITTKQTEKEVSDV